MRLKRLLNLLCTFRPDERARLRLYVQSPYFVPEQTAAGLLPLLDFVLQAVETPSDAWPDTAATYTALFPNEPVVKGKVEKRIGALQELVMQFFLQTHSVTPEKAVDNQLVVARVFQERGLFEYSHAVIKTLRNRLTAMSKQDDNYFLRWLKLAETEINQGILQNAKILPRAFEAYFEALFLYYQAVKMNAVVALVSQNRRIDYNPSKLAQHILNEPSFDGGDAYRNPILYLCLRHLELSRMPEPDLAAFDQTELYLRQHEHLLQPDEVKRAWGMLRNNLLYWFHINKDLEFFRRYFAIVLDNLASGHALYHNAILPQTLETFCKIAMTIGQMETAREVLLIYRGRIINEPSDEPYFHYNLARYHLYTGNPDEAFRILPDKLPDDSFLLQLKVLELEILYDLQSDLLPYRMDALRLLLRRTTRIWIEPTFRLSAQLFLNALARLHRCPQGNIRRAKAIQGQLYNALKTGEYHWLLQKVEEKMNP